MIKDLHYTPIVSNACEVCTDRRKGKVQKKLCPFVLRISMVKKWPGTKIFTTSYRNWIVPLATKRPTESPISNPCSIFPTHTTRLAYVPRTSSHPTPGVIKRSRSVFIVSTWIPIGNSEFQLEPNIASGRSLNTLFVYAFESSHH